MRAYCDEWDFRYTWTERQKLRKTQTGIQSIEDDAIRSAKEQSAL